MKCLNIFLKLNLLMLLSYTATSEVTMPLVSHLPKNCLSKCGEVEIPYPYGIGKGCYWKKWYEIICNTTTVPNKPYLKLLEVEVLNINTDSPDSHSSEDSTITANIDVRMPVFSSACSTGKTSSPSINLTGTPYFFSPTNQLTVIGCNLRAMVTVFGSNFVGCRSTCDASKDQKLEKYMNCVGYKCCQTPISSSPQSFSVEIEPVNATIERLQPNGGCEGAVFFTHEAFIPFNVSVPKDVQNDGFMTVKLEWYLDDFVPYVKHPVGYYCRNTQWTTIPDSYNYSSCGCENGYSGNPHILDGCKDIDECKLPFPGDQSLCGKEVCVNTKGSFRCDTKKIWVIIYGLSAGLGLLLLVIGLWRLTKFIKKRKVLKRKMKLFKRNGGLLLQQRLNSSSARVEKAKIFTSKELEKATDKFSESRILGEGGQGTVYKGMLLDGQIVAVKKSKLVDEDKLEEFINEIVILSQIDHRNIVKLLGCCLESEIPILVYEFIPNGDLMHHLHNESEEFFMDWNTRLRIASEIATSLWYLHSAASVPIYHRDIKSTNILLDEKQRAKISDFGTSRSIAIDDTHKTMTFVIGTYGYIDPEYIRSSRYTEKSDVYSFGVVLVELLTRKRSVFSSGPLKGTSLAVYFCQAMKSNTLYDILDPRIKEDHNKTEIMGVANIARICLSLKRNKRPTMKEVAMDLERIRTKKGDLVLQAEYSKCAEDDAEELSIKVEDSWEEGMCTSPSFENDTTLSLDSDPLFLSHHD